MRYACHSDPTFFCLITLIIFDEEGEIWTPKNLRQKLSSEVNRKVIGKLLNKAYYVTYARIFHYTYYYCSNIIWNGEREKFRLNRFFIPFIIFDACLENITTTTQITENGKQAHMWTMWTQYTFWTFAYI
jgi:magnesium-transporting ATPase (P-type)